MRAFILAFSMLLGTNLWAQRTCISPASSSSYSARPEMATVVSAAPPRDTIANEIITIPVVVHVIYNVAAQNISDAQILSQLKVLNNDFRKLNPDTVNTPTVFKLKAADSRIMFCLAQVDPQGRPTKGIIRRQTWVTAFRDEAMKFTAAGGDDAWDAQRYLNIWVCNMMGRSLGFATFPGGEHGKDGVVINWDVFGTTGNVRSPFNKGRTATHEVGHWLGLKHIWGEDLCGDDGVFDTPTQKSYNYGCPSFPHRSTCSPDANGDMFMNYMDLADDACMNMFTHGQKIKMRSLFALHGARNTFLNSFACDSTLASGGPIPADTIKIVPAAALTIYPNPVTTVLTVEAVNGYVLKGTQYQVFNLQGVRMLQGIFQNEKNGINMAKIPSGIYILKLINGKSKEQHKIIKM